MRRWLAGALCAFMPLLAAVALAQGGGASAPLGADGLLQVPPLARVVDQPHVLTDADRGALEARLARFESDNGAQIAIVIVASTAPEPIEDFANRVGSSWKIGRRGVGDGLLMVLATKDHHSRIEVARALEGAIPDAIAKRVNQQTMAPYFRNGDFAGGLNAGLDQLLPRIEQERMGGPPAQLPRKESRHGVGLNLLLPLVLFGAFAGSAMRRALGAGGALLTGGGAGLLGALLLGSVALGVVAGVLVFVLSLVLGAAGRYGHAVGGPGGIWFPGSWGGGSGGGFGGGGGGFGSGGGGDFSGGGASGDW